MVLFGGSFDPIHLGHLIVGRAAAEQLGATRVVLVPSAAPPHKQDRPLTPIEHRLRMCRLAVADDPLFELSDWEARRPGPNYTLHTVRHFRRQLAPAVPLYWLVGMDSLAELHTWYQVAELVKACAIVTAGRPGSQRPDLGALGGVLSEAQIQELGRRVLQTPLIGISASDIRARVRAGRSIRHLVPDAVRRYIDEHALYRDPQQPVA